MLVMQLKDCSYAQRARKYKLMIYFVVTFFTYILRHEPGLHFVQFKNIIKRGRPDNKKEQGRCYFEMASLIYAWRTCFSEITVCLFSFSIIGFSAAFTEQPTGAVLWFDLMKSSTFCIG